MYYMYPFVPYYYYGNTNPTTLPAQLPFPMPFPGQRSPRPGQQGQGQGQRPSTPPPSVVPVKPIRGFAIDAPSMALCLFRWTSIWLTNGTQIWFWPVFVGATSVAGFTWPLGSGAFGIDARRIDVFVCS